MFSPHGARDCYVALNYPGDKYSGSTAIGGGILVQFKYELTRTIVTSSGAIISKKYEPTILTTSSLYNSVSQTFIESLLSTVLGTPNSYGPNRDYLVRYSVFGRTRPVVHSTDLGGDQRVDYVANGFDNQISLDAALYTFVGYT